MNIKGIIKTKAPLVVHAFRRARNVMRKIRHGRRPVDQVFTEIYRTNYWGSEHSASGPGSDLRQTEVVRRELPRILESISATSLLDAPCGDFFWMSKVDLRGISYVGMDVVPDMIESCREKYGSPERQFLVGDISTSKLPQVDLILCRDCLIHLPLAVVHAALANFKRSGSKYLLTTIYPEHPGNWDIAPGDWRGLDFEKPPFGFPPPILVLNEGCSEGHSDEYRDKSLALWRLQDLPV